MSAPLRLPPEATANERRNTLALNSELLLKAAQIVGVIHDGTNFQVRFRTAFSVTTYQIHVQSTSAGEGGATYDPDNYESSTERYCGEERFQDVTIASVADVTHYLFLIPVGDDGLGTTVLYDGEDGPDVMAFIELGRSSTDLAAHEATTSSPIHGSASAATVSRLVHRDASGRAKVVDPSANDDIATKGSAQAQANAAQAAAEATAAAALSSHAGTETSPIHGSTSAATASKLMHRDASGRAQVAAPSVAADIARKDTVDAVATDLATHLADSTPHSFGFYLFVGADGYIESGAF